MRRNPARWHRARLLCGVSMLTLLVMSAAQAQTPTAKPATDSAPLSRFAPRDGLLIHMEFNGLDAHEAAWRQTAAFKMLNDTPLGVMLEDVAGQMFQKLADRGGERKFSGTEIVTVLKHVARSGFLFAGTAPKAGGDPAKDSVGVMVLRNGARKDVRALFSRLMLAMGGTGTKAELSKQPDGRSIVRMSGAAPTQRWTWWAEKDDLVVVMGTPQQASIIGEVLDGKRPNAVEHPIRSELSKSEDAFEPAIIAFVDFAQWPDVGSSRQFADRAQLHGVNRIDFRWGFSGDALMSVTRIKAPKPRQGLLSLLDQPTFDFKKLPPMPEGIEGFSVVSIDLGKTFDTVSSLLKAISPAASERLDGAVDALRSKGRLQLRKDVLAHFGSKIAFYQAPGSSSSAKGAADNAPAAGGAAGIPNPLAMLATGVQIPRITLVMEVNDPVAFGRSLDSLMIFANKQLRAAVSPPGEAGDATGSGNRRPGGARGNRDGAAAPEFKMTGGAAKSYILSLPNELGKLPPGIRPTIRFEGKHLAIAISPDVARQALEIKKGEAWSPSEEVSTAFEHLPTGLVYLNLNDPREKMPDLLAALPARLQAAINMSMLMGQMGAKMGAQASGAAGMPSIPGAGFPLQPGGSAPGIPGAPGAPGAPGGAGAQGFPGAPGAPGALRGGAGGPPGYPGAGGPSGAGGQGAAPADELIQIQVDPAKLPKADALRALLFPGTFAVAEDDQEVRFVTRQAFPNVMVPLSGMTLSITLPALMNAQKAAAANAAAPGPGGAIAPAPSPSNSNSQPPRQSRGARREN